MDSNTVPDNLRSSCVGVNCLVVFQKYYDDVIALKRQNYLKRHQTYTSTLNFLFVCLLRKTGSQKQFIRYRAHAAFVAESYFVSKKREKIHFFQKQVPFVENVCRFARQRNNYGKQCFRNRRCIERFHVTSRQPYWCSKTKKWRPHWCTKAFLRELNSIFYVKIVFCFSKPIWPLVT